MKAVASIFAVLATALAATVAAAQQQGPQLTAAQVAAAFEANGVGTSISTDEYGDPYVELQIGAALPADFANVFFFDCDSGGACDSILMVASYRPQRRPVYLDAINQWNVDRRWVRAYIDAENYIVLDMDVSGYGGITDQALGTQVARFVDSIVAFSQYIER